MLTLYGVFRSRASRPLWLLGETGTAFRHVPVIQAYRLADRAAPDAPLNTASPGYLAVNPMGQIPALTDGELLLTESLAITLHIARVYGGDLGPATPAELALMENWALFAATSVETPALEITYAQANGTGRNARGPRRDRRRRRTAAPSAGTPAGASCGRGPYGRRAVHRGRHQCWRNASATPRHIRRCWPNSPP